MMDNNETTTVWRDQLNLLESEIKREQKKYPLSDREQLMFNTLKSILTTLDVNCKLQ